MFALNCPVLLLIAPVGAPPHGSHDFHAIACQPRPQPAQVRVTKQAGMPPPSLWRPPAHPLQPPEPPPSPLFTLPSTSSFLSTSRSRLVLSRLRLPPQVGQRHLVRGQLAAERRGGDDGRRGRPDRGAAGRDGAAAVAAGGAQGARTAAPPLVLRDDGLGLDKG